MGIFDAAREQAEQDKADPKVAEAIAMAKEKLKGSLGGSPLRALTEATQIGRSLGQSEDLVTMVKGELNGKRGVAALTSDRIIFAESSVTRSHMETFDLDEVDTVSVAGVMNVKLKIGARRRTATIEKALPPGRAQEFVDCFQKMVRPSALRPSPPAGPASGSADLAGQLERLAGLHGSGVLSDDEFAQAKAQLLNQT